MVNVYFEPLKKKVEEYITKQEHLDYIAKAFEYAYNAHGTQLRKSGEPYIVHPVDVALTLTDYRVDPTTLAAALLHDVIEDTDYTYDDIKNEFGEELADIVEGLTKLKKIEYQGNKVQAQVANHQKMILAMAKDIRVIFVKLADRLNNMRTLKYLDDERKIRISNETLDIYAPIAHRLGMYRLKAELEDLGFKYAHRTDYDSISKLIKEKKISRENDVNLIISELTELLTKENFNFTISGRVKNIYSVFNKMNKKKISFEDIYDLLALRIIVDTVGDCYRAIGIVHNKFQPIPGRFKDYIAMPKPNMYQSLHTAVLKQGKIYEIQIRTKEMDQIAEYGVAAHWAYKESHAHSRKNIEDIVSSKLRWYSELIKFTEDGSNTSDDVLDIFTEDILAANVYVFTPNGDIIDLPNGSTPIDFAFRIHSRVGEKCVGAIVNSKIVPLDYKLQTGDVLEIKTSPNAVGPNENWMKIAKSSNARSKIRAFLNKKNRDILVEKGRSELLTEIQNRKLDISLTDKLVKEKFEERGIKTVEDLFYEVGKNVITVVFTINTIIGREIIDEHKLIEQINEKNKNRTFHEDSNIIVEGLTSPSVKLSNCCNPIPGDEIVGYISKGAGVAVHRVGCNNIKSLDQNRFIPVFWGKENGKRFLVNLKIHVENRDNILAEIINTCTSTKCKVSKVSANTVNALEGLIKITLEVFNLRDLEVAIANIEKLKGTFFIERVCK